MQHFENTKFVHQTSILIYLEHAHAKHWISRALNSSFMVNMKNYVQHFRKFLSFFKLNILMFARPIELCLFVKYRGVHRFSRIVEIGENRGILSVRTYK